MILDYSLRKYFIPHFIIFKNFCLLIFCLFFFVFFFCLVFSLNVNNLYQILTLMKWALCYVKILSIFADNIKFNLPQNLKHDIFWKGTCKGIHVLVNCRLLAYNFRKMSFFLGTINKKNFVMLSRFWLLTFGVGVEGLSESVKKKKNCDKNLFFR